MREFAKAFAQAVMTQHLLPSPMSPALRVALRDVEQRLRGRFGDRLRFIRLFGSYARFEATEDSDIDLAIVVDGLTGSDRAAVLDDLHLVERETDFFLSPFIVSGERFDELTRQGNNVATDIAAEGIAP